MGKIPDFKTLDEAVEFWETHSLADYADELEPVEVEVRLDKGKRKIIEKKIKLVGSKGECELIALFDSGATYSCIDRDLAATLGSLEPLPEPFLLETARKGAMLEVKERVVLNFYLDGYRFSDEFMVIPDLSERLIIGAKTMQAWRFKLDFEAEEVIIDPRVTKLRLL
ncbi:MAG: aspartyl protease family protein [Anaerolineae bacterium]